MAALTLNSADIMDFGHFPDPQSVGQPPVPGPGNGFIGVYRSEIGTIRFKNAMFPHMHVMDLRWETEREMVLHDSTLSDTININFQMAGNLDTKFWGITHELNMRPGTHNLVFSPEGGDINRVCSNSLLEMFHISLEKNFFRHAIGCDDHWSEQIQNNLEYDRPFSGIKGTLGVTPPMLRLIEEIRECNAAGPMRNLLIQSKTLELLALQMDQFRRPYVTHDEIHSADAEKLHQLRAYLDANFLAEQNLAHLSKICLLNEFKVKKGFKLLFGTTVFGYLRQLRMEYAKKLLSNCKISVEEVADALGYEHAHHFSTAFKKYTGKNPSHYM
ncbi:helix-turn-helix domain-containing protein [Dyadobacter pollutisoli]|uniref:AraC family transcriptional regulator n=1 Tax=Dyadobacter pollutisoli TaxID=2910158 RepID=A0A9E8SMQ9_9BACT|nr:AraC family transcriptional regulator [Dyadobacter pollutisoli]WAC14403.1 AraC family transcriptional regulator [Dyadobacter pollutisoli]